MKIYYNNGNEPIEYTNTSSKCSKKDILKLKLCDNSIFEGSVTKDEEGKSHHLALQSQWEKSSRGFQTLELFTLREVPESGS